MPKIRKECFRIFTEHLDNTKENPHVSSSFEFCAFDGKRDAGHFYDKLESVNGSVEMFKTLYEKYGIYATACVFQTTNKNIEGSITIDIPQQEVKFEVDIYRARTDKNSIDAVLYVFR